MEAILNSAVVCSFLVLLSYWAFRFFTQKHERRMGSEKASHPRATMESLRKERISLGKINHSIDLRISLMEECSARPDFSPGKPEEDSIISDSEALASELDLDSRK